MLANLAFAVKRRGLKQRVGSQQHFPNVFQRPAIRAANAIHVLSQVELGEEIGNVRGNLGVDQPKPLLETSGDQFLKKAPQCLTLQHKESLSGRCGKTEAEIVRLSECWMRSVPTSCIETAPPGLSTGPLRNLLPDGIRATAWWAAISAQRIALGNTCPWQKERREERNARANKSADSTAAMV